MIHQLERSGRALAFILELAALERFDLGAIRGRFEQRQRGLKIVRLAGHVQRRIARAVRLVGICAGREQHLKLHIAPTDYRRAQGRGAGRAIHRVRAGAMRQQEF